MIELVKFGIHKKVRNYLPLKVIKMLFILWPLIIHSVTKLQRDLLTKQPKSGAQKQANYSTHSTDMNSKLSAFNSIHKEF